MLWVSSLFFLAAVRKAWRTRRRGVAGALVILTTTSVLHHGGVGPAAISTYDRWWAHLCGLWGALRGVREKKWHLVPHIAWIVAAFYFVEPRIAPSTADWVHATIHGSATHAFYQLM